jgi:hypothetical protein
MKTILAIAIAGLLMSAGVFAASPKMTCTLTGKQVKACCCEQQKDGKLLCKLTGKKLDKCCCKEM